MSAGDIFSSTAQTWTLGGNLTISGADISTNGNLTIKPGQTK
jgi:lipid-binding SYLF domain-containing protein